MGRDQCGNNDYSLDLYIVREVRTQYELEQRAGAPPRGGLHWTQVATSLRHCNHPLVVCKASVLNLFLESIPRDENAEQVFFFFWKTRAPSMRALRITEPWSSLLKLKLFGDPGTWRPSNFSARKNVQHSCTSTRAIID